MRVMHDSGPEPKPLKMHRQISKIHCPQSENKPDFLKPRRVRVRFPWVTAVFLQDISENQTEHRAGKPTWWNPDLRIWMIIALPCCFWQHCSIIRNKLTWKHTRPVSLSAPLSIQMPLLPPPLLPSYNYLPPPRLPRPGNPSALLYPAI